MGFLDRTFRFLTGAQAGSGQLPTVPPTKPPTKATALPSWKRQVAKSTSAIQNNDRRATNIDLTTYRTGIDTNTVVRDFVAVNPDLAGTVNAYLRVGIPERYTVIARDMDGAVNVKATQLAQECLRRLTLLGDPSLGYNPVTDLQSLSESLAKELLLYGAMGLELALDKMRLPLNLNAVSVTKLKWYEEEGGVYPVQSVGGEERKLDIPTFFYFSVDQDLLQVYPESYLQSAVQAVIADTQFLNDLRRAMARALQPRMVATIIEEKVEAGLDPETKADPVKKQAFYNNLISELTNLLNGLQPDEALVKLDSVEYEMLTPDGKGGDIAATLEKVQKLLESKIAAGAKSLPAVLGRESNGTTASVSTMLFMKNANIIRTKLNVAYSRALTQAVRLLGEDVFVEFEYDDLDLRPQGELEAYFTMRQSRILQQLSLGLISDEDACIKLTGNLPPAGYKPLSGTMFMTKTEDPNANPDSQTSNMNKGGAPDKTKPSTPSQPKSQKG